MPACMHRVTNGQLHEFINFVHVMLNEIKQTVFYNRLFLFQISYFLFVYVTRKGKNQLKQSGEKPQTRVIFCSTLNMPFINDILQNKAVGFYTRDCLYLLKPIVEDLFCQNQKIKINRVKCTIKNPFWTILV